MYLQNFGEIHIGFYGCHTAHSRPFDYETESETDVLD